MNEEPLTKLLGGVNKFLGAIARRDHPLSFTPTGLIVDRPIKDWYGTTTSINGIFTLDISSAGFTQILHVVPQAVYNSSDFNKQAQASLNLISLTSITGRVFTGASEVFKSDALIAAPNMTVMVKVTGR